MTHARFGRRIRVPQAGFTLVEVTISMVMVSAALGLMVSSVLSLTHARRISQDREAVTTVMTRAIETLQALGPTDAFVAYKGVEGVLPVGAPFTVNGVQGLNNQPVAINIEFVTDELSDDPEMALPRDLDGNGAIDNADVGKLKDNGDLMATILPVRLTATWLGVNGGIRTLSWSTVLTKGG